MSQRIEEKKGQLSLEIESLQRHRAELLELIRTTPDYFHQLLAHVQNDKVETFLEKDEKYRCAKESIEKLEEDISQDVLRQRQRLLIEMDLPETLRRAFVMDTCSACSFKHNFNKVMMIGCGHLIHEECFRKLRRDDCPLCRRDFSKLPSTYGTAFGGYRHDSFEF